VEVIGVKNTFALERGKVFFSLETDTEAVFRLRCADNVYLVVKRFQIGGHKEDLRAFADAIGKIDFGGLFARKPVSFVVSASRAGRQTYSRFELSDAAAEALVSTGLFTPGDNNAHDAAFRIDVKDDACVFSMQLTPPEFRFRGASSATVPGGIRPTVAHCLVRLSRPRGGDVFYDPFCGAGTIAAERAFYGHRRIFASDICGEAVSAAQANLRSGDAGRGAVVFRADAVATGMKSGSVDAVVSNVPWGKQVAVDGLEGLYAGFLRELRRILKDGGRAVILTDRREEIGTACREAGFEMRTAAEFSLHGLRPGAFELRKIM
ncbi:MAG: RNA methyltransferase, partial [Defluviitaleaceae bacterium]|nr:RNA methyltransferase [Defluviitaleaceae bacterium]